MTEFTNISYLVLDSARPPSRRIQLGQFVLESAEFFNPRDKPLPLPSLHGEVGARNQQVSGRGYLETHKNFQTWATPFPPFFSDYLILFAEVTMDHIEVIFECLDKVCVISGQKVSMHKSNIAFSFGVDVAVASNIYDISKIHVVFKLEKYLEIPSIMGRVNTGLFQHDDAFFNRNWARECWNSWAGTGTIAGLVHWL